MAYKIWHIILAIIGSMGSYIIIYIFLGGGITLLEKRNSSYTVEFSDNSLLILLVSTERFKTIKMGDLGPVSSNINSCGMPLREQTFLLSVYLLPRGDHLCHCSSQALGEGAWNIQEGDFPPG